MGNIISGSMLNYDNIVIIAAVVLSVFLCKHRGLPGNFLLTGVLPGVCFKSKCGWNVRVYMATTKFKRRIKAKKFVSCIFQNQVECEICFFTLRLTMWYSKHVLPRRKLCALWWTNDVTSTFISWLKVSPIHSLLFSFLVFRHYKCPKIWTNSSH